MIPNEVRKEIYIGTIPARANSVSTRELEAITGGITGSVWKCTGEMTTESFNRCSMNPLILFCIASGTVTISWGHTESAAILACQQSRCLSQSWYDVKSDLPNTCSLSHIIP